MDILEIEVKSRCEDMQLCMEQAKSLGARFVEKRTEVDSYFTHPSRDFGTTDEALRIRRLNGRSVLTYKGPKIGTRAKTRIEEEVVVADFDAMKSILARLGFREYGMVTKSREIYLLRDTEICFDSIEGLGSFVELERKGTDRDEIEKKLFELAEELGLERFERRSYLEMVKESAGGKAP